MNQASRSTPSRKERIIVIGLVVLGLILVIFFGLRTVRSYVRIHETGLHPGATNVEAIHGWMTVPYIARAYNVPPDYIFKQIGLPPEGNQRKSLSRLNREYAPGQPGKILEAVKRAITQYQAEQPRPPGNHHE